METAKPALKPYHYIWGALLGFMLLVGLSRCGADQQTADTSKTPQTQTAADPEPPKKVSEGIFIGHTANVETAFPACREKADIARIKNLALQGDHVAATRYAEDKSCVLFNAGDSAVVEDVSSWSGTTCLRRAGEPDCYWFPTPFLANGR